MIARKKMKNQDPTYWPVVVGAHALENIIVARLLSLKVIVAILDMLDIVVVLAMADIVVDDIRPWFLLDSVVCRQRRKLSNVLYPV